MSEERYCMEKRVDELKGQNGSLVEVEW